MFSTVPPGHPRAHAEHGKFRYRQQTVIVSRDLHGDQSGGPTPVTHPGGSINGSAALVLHKLKGAALGYIQPSVRMRSHACGVIRQSAQGSAVDHAERIQAFGADVQLAHGIILLQFRLFIEVIVHEGIHAVALEHMGSELFVHSRFPLSCPFFCNSAYCIMLSGALPLFLFSLSCFFLT